MVRPDAYQGSAIDDLGNATHHHGNHGRKGGGIVPAAVRVPTARSSAKAALEAASAAINSREDWHLQECLSWAHTKKPPEGGFYRAQGPGGIGSVSDQLGETPSDLTVSMFR